MSDREALVVLLPIQGKSILGFGVCTGDSLGPSASIGSVEIDHDSSPK